MHNRPKPKVVRVVTASYVVPWHLANTLRRLPADFEVSVVGQGVSSNEGAYTGIEWVDIDLNRKISMISDIRSLWMLCNYFRRVRPDIVHSIMPKAGLLSALAGFLCRVPIRIHTFTGQTWEQRPFFSRFLLYTADRIINALNTVCLTDSPSQSRFLYQRRFTHRGELLPVLESGSLSGVELARFRLPDRENRVAQLRAELGIRKQDFVFAYIARKTRDKGAIDMLLAFSKLVGSHPDARLLFVGPDESGNELHSLKSATPALFRNVIEVGQVDSDELYLLLSNVLCLPSYREGFGSIVIDAAAAGVPAIGSNIVGLIDSIEDGTTGLLFSPGNRDSLVQAMTAMVENPQRRIEMGAAARSRVEAKFSAETLYAALKDFYFRQLASRAQDQADRTTAS